MLLHVSFVYQLNDGLHMKSGSFLFSKFKGDSSIEAIDWYNNLIDELTRSIRKRFSLPEDVGIGLVSINTLVDL